jgi:hypothetical protein
MGRRLVSTVFCVWLTFVRGTEKLEQRSHFWIMFGMDVVRIFIWALNILTHKFSHFQQACNAMEHSPASEANSRSATQ